MSIPQSARTFLAHLLTVSLLAGPWGLTVVMKRSLVSPLKYLVRLKYSMRVEATHQSGLSGHFGRNRSGEAVPGLVVLIILSMSAQIPSSTSYRLSMLMLQIVWTLCPVASNNNMVSFSESLGKSNS